jgi:hypothetical protein
MKWILTSVMLATLIATPTLAARQHLNRDDYWNVTPVAQIFPPRDASNYLQPRRTYVQPRLYGSTMHRWPLVGVNTRTDA